MVNSQPYCTAEHHFERDGNVWSRPNLTDSMFPREGRVTEVNYGMVYLKGTMINIDGQELFRADAASTTVKEEITKNTAPTTAAAVAAAVRQETARPAIERELIICMSLSHIRYTRDANLDTSNGDGSRSAPFVILDDLPGESAAAMRIRSLDGRSHNKRHRSPSPTASLRVVKTKGSIYGDEDEDEHGDEDEYEDEDEEEDRDGDEDEHSWEDKDEDEDEDAWEDTEDDHESNDAEQERDDGDEQANRDSSGDGDNATADRVSEDDEDEDEDEACEAACEVSAKLPKGVPRRAAQQR